MVFCTRASARERGNTRNTQSPHTHTHTTHTHARAFTPSHAHAHQGGGGAHRPKSTPLIPTTTTTALFHLSPPAPPRASHSSWTGTWQMRAGVAKIFWPSGRWMASGPRAVMMREVMPSGARRPAAFQAA